MVRKKAFSTSQITAPSVQRTVNTDSVQSERTGTLGAANMISVVQRANRNQSQICSANIAKALSLKLKHSTPRSKATPGTDIRRNPPRAARYTGTYTVPLPSDHWCRTPNKAGCIMPVVTVRGLRRQRTCAIPRSLGKPPQLGNLNSPVSPIVKKEPLMSRNQQGSPLKTWSLRPGQISPLSLFKKSLRQPQYSTPEKLKGRQKWK